METEAASNGAADEVGRSGMAAGDMGQSEAGRPWALHPTTGTAAGGAGHSEGRKPWAFHDPTAGMGGVVPTRMARLWLAVVGLLLCIASALVSFQLGMTWAGVLLAVLSATTVVNLGWVLYRRRRS
jgi:hypothetical protein